MKPFRFPEALSAAPVWGVFQNVLESVQPPDWVVDEVQNRVVLLLNHVLQQEPVAQERLRVQRGRTARLVWGRFELALRATPAGLLERLPRSGAGDPVVVPDLSVEVADGQLAPMVQALARGERPKVNIVGDVQLAAEVAWLADNLRWDVEEDLSRLMGDVPAHNLVLTAKTALQAISAFLARPSTSTGSSADQVSV
jgi:ubiquinone biosynthesis accessory factor UbiJ